jgi:RimJ/RimL family protein N-acetyltransferase
LHATRFGVLMSRSDAVDVLETERLIMRRFTADDAAFILQLVNEPAFHRFIGDRNVRSMDDARAYLTVYMLAGYTRYGHGPYIVQLKETSEPVGQCGLLKKEWLQAWDVGYAFLAKHRSRGYALESARAVIRNAHEALGLDRIVAVTTADNASSIRLLDKLGFEFERKVRTPDGEELELFALHRDMFPVA